ncbi:MAG: hypothetical protein LQ338_004441 [Usnochroma carphineum]|nr:MAG: hypothetical protein LQ338_004441 [Usnochroma carphineum]
MGPAVWLRTCYTEGSDQRHDELVKGIDMLLAVDGDHRLLNDPDLYNFGADWQRVFDVLPELLQPSDGDWTYYQEAQCKALEDLTAFAEGGVARAPPKLLENLSSFQGEELEQIVREALQSEVHTAHVVTWIVLEDEKALANGEVAVMFVDAYGRVIRSKRTEVGEASMMGGAWVNCCWDEMDIWEEAVLGEEYQIGGSCGGLLLESIRNS